ncbi:MAG: glycogen/starch synthase [FCB group bacterium]|nr:glycogen/starch synthase [FCB group bacterium]
MARKIFYLTTEITPFASTSPLGEFSAKVPLALQSKGHDIRTMIPKYGFVSERKYILREVIRLREIPFTFEGQDQMVSAKSAFIPKTRVQVYFLEHKEWFSPLNNLLYKAKNGRVLSDNDMRSAFYSISALASLPHLFWSPDIVFCNGWQTSLVPLAYREIYAKDSFYKDIHTVLVIHNLDEYDTFARSVYESAGVTVPEDLKGATLNCYEVAAYSADRIIIFDTPSNQNSTQLLKRKGFKANAGKVDVIPWDDDENPDYSAIADSIDATIEKLFS